MMKIRSSMARARRSGSELFTRDRRWNPSQPHEAHTHGHTPFRAPPCPTCHVDLPRVAFFSGGDTIVRGVRVTGDVYRTGGNVAAIFVEVEGNVIANGNGAL